MVSLIIDNNKKSCESHTTDNDTTMTMRTKYNHRENLFFILSTIVNQENFGARAPTKATGEYRMVDRSQRMHTEGRKRTPILELNWDLEQKAKTAGRIS